MISRLGRFVAVSAVLMTAIFVAASDSEATSISGSVSFSGGWAPTGGTGIADATGINILGDSAIVLCAQTPWDPCTGDYASLTGAITADYNDFTFNPLGPPVGGPVAPLWEFTYLGDTYNFDLETVVITAQNASGISLIGTGTLRITGLDDTKGTWSFSGDTSGGKFAFSSTASVSDGGSTVAFLGLGMLVVGLLGRRTLF